MSDPGAIVAVVASACMASAYAIKVIAGAILKHKEIESRNGAPAIGASDERMARLEVAVESIALEVERISEGQRFTTKLLSEAAQHSTPWPQKSAKMNTPH